ncbi:MAG: hypothetical protein ACPGES_00855 [Coraliomargarita sp.]
MSSPTNLTGRITQLRDRKESFLGQQSGGAAPEPKPLPRTKRRERKFATDSFMLFAYSLFAVALIVQVVLIVWLDLV